MGKATAVANPNIAFVKYWGRIDGGLNLPANASVSMNLGALTTVTTVEFRPGRQPDRVSIDGVRAEGQALARVAAHLDRVRELAGIADPAVVASRNDYPAGTGLASSAAAFAALSLAAASAAGLALGEADLSRLARRGSGSACRSVPDGFALWEGDTDLTSYARSIASADHWALRDVVAIVRHRHKEVGSGEGHALAPTSPFYETRRAGMEELVAEVRSGIERRDLAALGAAAEADAMAMHAVMLTSRPSLLYWEPATVAVLQAVRRWRAEGLTAYATLDAGPNVHCLCEAHDAEELEGLLRSVAGVEDVLASGPGGAVRPVDYHLF